MKARTLAAQNTIAREYAVRAQPRVTAEWEYNRFLEPTVTIVPEQLNRQGTEEWAVNFGNQLSIVEPNRPRTGIAKARLENGVRPLGEFRDTPQAARFYPVSPSDTYQYWGSIERSSLAQTNGSYNFDAPIEVTVMYPEQIITNKIVAGFETSYAKPTQLSIETTVDGKTWKLAASNPAVDTDGRVTLWAGGLGWDSVKGDEYPVVIKGIRLKVYAMNKGYQHLDVLQFGARLHNDLTELVISYETNLEVSDRSFIAPMGKASGNTADLTLSNIDRRFNNSNEESVYYGLIDKRVRFTIELGINTVAQGGVGFEYIREFTGWSDAWGSTDQTEVKVSLVDSSIFLAEMAMPVMFLENMTAGAIVWNIMDKIGMSNYAYSRATNDYGQIIPFFWPEDTSTTVWEQIGSLAESTQTAVYFDEHDVLQIRARRAMYGDKQVDWNFDAVQNGLKLPDIEDIEVGYDLESNRVEVSYQPTAYGVLSNKMPKMETVWEPEEDDVVLRASSLQRDLVREGNELWIKQAEASSWPFESVVNIRGEMMRYKGKEYAYYNKNVGLDPHTGAVLATAHTLQTKVIYTLDEKNALDALDEDLYWKNSFTGKFIVTERHLYGSGWGNHLVEPTEFTDLITRADNSVFYPINRQHRTMVDGIMRVGNPSSWHADYHYVKSPNALDAPVNWTDQWYGTRLKFDPDVKWSIAGMVCGGDWGDTGFYVELATTETVGVEGVRVQNELQVKAMPGNAPELYPVSQNGDVRGVKQSVLRDVWYDLDVRLERRPANHISITVYLNGVYAGWWVCRPAMIPPMQGRYGVYVRGAALADFEYVYAYTRDGTDTSTRTPDDTSFTDLKTGGLTSGFLQKEIRYNWRHINPGYYWPGGWVYFPQMINDTYFAFDEFGPVVHEVREFNVTFAEETRPVGSSYLYLTSPEQVEVISYESDAFGATFMLVNAMRRNVIVKGDDDITYPENSQNQAIFVYGAPVYQEEEKSIIKEDIPSIRKRGPSKVEVSNRYIQSAEMANELGQWILDLWASGVDEVTMNVFGNPFLQVGDLVTVNHPVKGMDPTTHKYFIVSVKGSFESGYTTEVVLRRARL